MKKDFRDAVFTVVLDLMRADRDIVVLNNDLGAYGLDAIRKEFPERAINVGVAEQNMMGLAGGLAASGKRVFVYGIIAHLMRGWEQIKVGICIPNLPVTILGLGAGLSSGLDGPTHHATEDVALMRAIANMTIYNPASWVCAEAVTRMAYEARTPHYIRLDKEPSAPIFYGPNENFAAGYAVYGDDLSDVIISTGIETQRAAHEKAPCIIDVYRLSPPPDMSYYLHQLLELGTRDVEAVRAMKLSNVCIRDESRRSTGLLSIIAELLCEVPAVTLPDAFLGPQAREPF